MLRVGVKRVFAWTHSVRAAPVQEIVEGDRLEAYVSAADRKPHEATVAAIEPVVIVATIGQFRNVIPRALKIGRGYNSNENLVHSTATSVLGSHRRQASHLHALSKIRERAVKA